jgi:hypothetical protein
MFVMLFSMGGDFRVKSAGAAIKKRGMGLHAKIVGSRTWKPNSPGRVAGTRLVDSENAIAVNDVNHVTGGRFYVTLASQSQRSPERRESPGGTQAYPDEPALA